MPEISLAPSVLFHIGPLAVTNSTLATLLVTVMLAWFAARVFKGMSLVPTRIQAFLEVIAEYLLSQLENAFGSKEEARKFFPLFMTLLIFIAVANQFSVLPIITQMVVGDTPLFRVPTAHLVQPLALAVLVVAFANIMALRIAPLKHIGGFVKIAPIFKARSGGQLAQALLDFFLGLLDIIGEMSKVLSLSFRLFGNIFSGEVMALVIASISVFTSFLVPVPFLFLSIFSGFVQAFVFALLSMQFISGTIRNVREEQGAAAPPHSA